MADKKISQLTAASTPLAGTEVLPIVQSGSTVKVSSDDLTVKNVRSNATTGVLQVVGPAAATTRVMTTPNANFTAARTDAAQTFTGDQVFSDNVGIGATTIGAQNKLHVRYSAVVGATYFSSAPLIVERSDVNLISLMSADGTDQGFLFGDASDNDIGGLFYIHGSDAMAFRTNTTEQLRISSAGNVTLNTGNLVIGTAEKGVFTDGAEALAFGVNNAEKGRITSSGFWKFSDAGTYNDSTGDYHEIRQTTNNTCAYISATNASFQYNVAALVTTRAANSIFNFISCAANSVDQFYVRGDGVIYAQNATVQAISDARLKENVRDATEGLDVIKALRPVRFDWKPGQGNDRKNQLGFIAQEVEAVLPDAVSEWKKAEDQDEAYKTVGPAAMIPVLVKALQEQQVIIDDLKARIEKLEKA